MKYLIIGGYQQYNNKKIFQKACQNIGKSISKSGDDLLICSPFTDSADYWVLKGFVNDKNNSNKGTVEIHFIDKKEIQNKINNLQSVYQSLKIRKIPHPNPNNDKSLKYAWLFCQLEALESCQQIIAIGGKVDGSANMLLLFAETRRKPIIPLLCMNGAAYASFCRIRYEIQDKFGHEYIELLKNTENINKILSMAKTTYSYKLNYNLNDSFKKFFISYPRDRNMEADYVETLLRRRNVQVFRDESEFGAGSNIPTEIREAIYKSNIFIAVWCKEYACSPWCFDEIELALDRRDQGKLKICILCVDDTRIVPKRARELLNFKIRSREDIESCILKLLEDK